MRSESQMDNYGNNNNNDKYSLAVLVRVLHKYTCDAVWKIVCIWSRHMENGNKSFLQSLLNALS